MLDLLKGCRVIDLTTIVLGPYATQMLGDLGADVIKVEAPAGDLFRASGPSRSDGMAPGFMNCNRNKRSLVLDLKTDDGRQVLDDLVRGADVVVHNMRPKAAAGLGLTYDALKEINPKLIFCTGPGYGPDGPYADDPAYDDIIQARSGFCRLNENAAGEPRFIPTIACDKITGLHLAVAVLGGLFRRERTGEGCYLEAPMFESVLSFLYVEHLAGLSFRPPDGGSGYRRITNPYRKPYKTQDGYLAVMPYDTGHWLRFLTLAGRADLAKADWVRDPQERSRNIERLYQVLEDALAERTSEAWLTDLKNLDIPCAPVNDLDGLLEDPHLKETGFFKELEHPTEGSLVSVRSPFTGVGVETGDDRPAPKKGAHSREILEELGYDAERMDALVRCGVVSTGSR